MVSPFLLHGQLLQSTTDHAWGNRNRLQPITHFRVFIIASDYFDHLQGNRSRNPLHWQRNRNCGLAIDCFFLAPSLIQHIHTSTIFI